MRGSSPRMTNERSLPLEFLEDAAEAVDAILDPATAQRVPIAHGVDRKDRLAEPAFRLGRGRNRRKRRADLQQRIHIGPVELLERASHLLAAHLRDHAW